jgi:hypothetical protein
LYKDLLQATNATSYAQIRQLSSAQLQAINAAMSAPHPLRRPSTVGHSFHLSCNDQTTSEIRLHFTGPNIDGVYIPSAPGTLFTQSRVDHAVQATVAHNLDEGLLFANPRVANQSGLDAFLQWLMPSLPASKVAYLATELYPPPPPASLGAGNLPYTTYVDRTMLAVGEALIDCFAFGVALAYANQTRGYQFSVFPSMYALDVGYSFGDGGAAETDSLGGPLVAADARAMQSWFVELARKETAAALPRLRCRRERGQRPGDGAECGA